MRTWLRGKPAGLLSFVLIAALVAGGLGWATAEALRLEREQLAQRAESERASKLRVALWRLDSRIAPILAREDSRPFNHYSAVYPLPLALKNNAACWPTGTVLEPSPLLGAELPSWMLLHFQTSQAAGWESPQVLSAPLDQTLRKLRDKLSFANVTPQRGQLLAQLKRELPATQLLQQAGTSTQPATVQDTTMILTQNNLDNLYNNANSGIQNPDAQMVQAPQMMNPTTQGIPQEYLKRSTQQSRLQNENKMPQKVPKDFALNSIPANGSNWFNSRVLSQGLGSEVPVHLSPMVPVWMTTAEQVEHLVVLRLVRIEETAICQGIVLDGGALQKLLADEVTDLFPDGKLTPMLEPVPPQPERTMTALPFELDPGPAPQVPDPGWTPLRFGLGLAWLAALVALLAVGLGGWSLIDLSERRIRFVSAVTHELRTPLTTLRLYLDMLVTGFVRDEKQRGEYIHTLFNETDRLNRLVGNVLDFSRLENQRPRLNKTSVPVADLLEQVRLAWSSRCQDADKEMIVENDWPADAKFCTDRELVQQVLGNLIDNACKYSRGAEDRRLWLRARRGDKGIIFEIEDRGPGIAVKDQRLIFRAFRRGRSADETAGGVGLGLALAQRWVRLLGGRLSLQSREAGCGACFRVELPLAAS